MDEVIEEKEDQETINISFNSEMGLTKPKTMQLDSYLQCRWSYIWMLCMWNIFQDNNIYFKRIRTKLFLLESLM